MSFHINANSLIDYINENHLGNEEIEVREDKISVSIRFSASLYIIYELFQSSNKNFLTESRVLLFDCMTAKYNLIDEFKAAELRGFLQEYDRFTLY